jgi:glucose-6-phosphate dehydrogenase assembly protein OpcA
MSEQAEPVTVPLHEVEHELSRQRKQLQDGDHAPMQRVHMSNLVIYCDSRERAEEVDAAIPDLSREHPARVQLLVADAEGEGEGLTATVRVRPLQNNPRHHNCVEQITVRAGKGAIEHLPFAMRTLLIGDLPTNLWWASPVPPPMAGSMLHELAEYAQQIIYDSHGWPDPARGISATASWLEQVERFDQGPRWRVASDLNWRRIKGWRRGLMQALDPASAPGADETATEIYIEYGQGAVIRSWLLAGWLVCRLGWHIDEGKIKPGVEVSWRCSDGPSTARVRLRLIEGAGATIQRVRVACRLQDKEAAIVVTIADGRRMTTQIEGVDSAPRTMTVPAMTPAEVVGRQLSDRERDPVFRASMTSAQVMARSVLH